MLVVDEVSPPVKSMLVYSTRSQCSYLIVWSTMRLDSKVNVKWKYSLRQRGNAWSGRKQCCSACDLMKIVVGLRYAESYAPI